MNSAVKHIRDDKESVKRNESESRTECRSGSGLATAAVRAMAGFAFRAARLHRLEAACVPTNLASRRVLEKAGFRKEGEARAYLKINGVWADHLLFGLVSDEFSAP